MALHTRLYRATDGRIGHHLPFLSPPFLLLDHVGAKTGAKRTSPVLYFRDGENVVIVASKGGFPKNPAWFYNLKANPETTIQIEANVRPVRARIASAEERERLWPKAEATWRAFRAYQARSQGREIPLVILEPR
jgi:F420H(2)-dependent quinone reductase